MAQKFEKVILILIALISFLTFLPFLQIGIKQSFGPVFQSALHLFLPYLGLAITSLVFLVGLIYKKSFFRFLSIALSVLTIISLFPFSQPEQFKEIPHFSSFYLVISFFIFVITRKDLFGKIEISSSRKYYTNMLLLAGIIHAGVITQLVGIKLSSSILFFCLLFFGATFCYIIPKEMNSLEKHHKVIRWSAYITSALNGIAYAEFIILMAIYGLIYLGSIKIEGKEGLMGGIGLIVTSFIAAFPLWVYSLKKLNIVKKNSTTNFYLWILVINLIYLVGGIFVLKATLGGAFTMH